MANATQESTPTPNPSPTPPIWQTHILWVIKAKGRHEAHWNGLTARISYHTGYREGYYHKAQVWQGDTQLLHSNWLYGSTLHGQEGAKEMCECVMRAYMKGVCDAKAEA